MALEIPCSNCGLRPYTEFAFGGELRPTRADSPEEDFARVFLPSNVQGVQRERWFHLFGCRRWTTLARDTTSNRIC